MSLHLPSIPPSTIIGIFNSDDPKSRSAAAIASYAAVCQLGQATIYQVSELTKTGRETTNNCLNGLVRAGFLEVEKGSNGIKGKQKNIYRIKP